MVQMFNLSIDDPLVHLKRLKQAGLSEAIAEIEVEETEKVIQAINQYAQQDLHNKDLSTKSDVLAVQNNVLLVQKDIALIRAELSLKIEQSRKQMLVWMFGMLSLFAGFIFTVLAKGFHWL